MLAKSKSNWQNKMSAHIPEAYYILADYGRFGRGTYINWESCTKQDAIDELSEHEYPLAVHCIDMEGKRWSDVSEDIALEILHRIVSNTEDNPRGGVRAFIELHAPDALEEMETERANARSDRAEHHTHWGQP